MAWAELVTIFVSSGLAVMSVLDITARRADGLKTVASKSGVQPEKPPRSDADPGPPVLL